jgi:hypothetical protein
MSMNGQDLLGSLSAQAGKRFPGPGPGCGLGAGACRMHRWAEPHEVLLGRPGSAKGHGSWTHGPNAQNRYEFKFYSFQKQISDELCLFSSLFN